jgi:hypothetical protein
MGIVNRRNALLGWTVWQIGKRVAKRKAKAAVPHVDPETKRPNLTLVLSVVGAVVGGLWLWWSRRDGDGDEPLP